MTRISGLKISVNLFNSSDSEYEVLGDVENIEYAVLDNEIITNLLGQNYPFIDYGAYTAIVGVEYQPQIDNASHLLLAHFNASITPPPRNVRISNESESLELVQARPLTVNYEMQRDRGLTVKETFLGINLSLTTNFSAENIVRVSSRTFNALDIQQIHICDNELVDFFYSWGLDITYNTLPVFTGTARNPTDVVAGIHTFSGFVEYSNQSMVDVTRNVSARTVILAIGGLDSFIFQNSIIYASYLNTNAPRQTRKLEWITPSMPLLGSNLSVTNISTILFEEPWSYAEPPEMFLIFPEPWSYDEPPNMSTSLFIEDWQYGDPIGLELKFLEPWGIGEPNISTSLFTEPWGYAEPSITTQIFVETWDTS